jgi:hypothetical protein
MAASVAPRRHPVNVGENKIGTEHYIDTRLAGAHRRIDDLIRLQERADDAAKESLDYRLAANDHDRDLIREDVADCVRSSRGDVLETRIASLERTVTLLVGGLTLAAVLAGIIVTVVIKYG